MLHGTLRVFDILIFNFKSLMVFFVSKVKAGTLESLCLAKIDAGLGLCNDLPHWSISVKLQAF